MHKDSIESLFTGANQIRLPSCHSTNQVASDLLSEAKSSEGTVIITDHQTAGKGQRGNSWESEPGKNLTLSVILKPEFLPVVRQFELTVVSSVAIVKTLEAVGLPDAQIKWPNDIYYRGSKIAGILIENSVRASKIDHSIVGVGLNVNQQHFQVEGATSVKMELGQEYPLNRLLEEFLKHLSQHYSLLKSGDFQQLRTLYGQI